MSNSALRVLAGAGAKDDPVYVDDVFSTFLWTGDSSGSRSINNGINLDGEGGLVWIKGRSASYDHAWYDTARGATKEMYSNKTDRQQTNSNALTSFNYNGFSIGDDSLINNNNEDYVAWSFRKAKGFFDVATYTGTGSTQTVSHDLGCKPGVVIVKRTDLESDWGFYARNGDSDSEIGIGYLNSYSSFTTSGISFTATSSAVTIFNTSFNFDATASGATFVVYFFDMGGTDSDAAVFGTDGDEAVIKCGSYAGDGGTSNFINVGFEPEVVLVKKTSSGNENWFIFDSMRGVPTGSAAATLIPNKSDAESAGGYGAIDFNATGFTLTSSTGGVNGSGNYFYMAIRRPHTPASEFAATSLFDLRYGQVATPVATTGFPVDFFIERNPNGTDGNYFFSRLTGSKYLQSNTTNAELTGSLSRFFDFSNGVMSSFGSAASYLVYSLRRAPGFFDVVIYTGTGSARTVTHNLGVAPEMIWVKRRAGTDQWYVYAAPNGNDKKQELNADSQAYTDSMWNNTTPSASTFSVDSTAGVNSNGQSIIAYLFASVDGISKLGSYTGTGSNVNVDCGFSAGARFVIIKRTDGSGDWYVYDSVRGIVAGDDPFLALNTNTAQTTNTDYIDPLSSGFTVTSSAPSQLNASGGTYLFLAIA